MQTTHLWHPCTQMKHHEVFPPLHIIKAYGSYLETKEGHKIIDAVSSWWCKSLGHGHPKLKQALFQQAEQFEHIMLADLTHEPILELSKKLAQLCQPLDKVFYGCDGSTALEVAMKMSIHAHQLQGKGQRTRFMALAGGYHGETALTMGVSDLGRFKAPYEPLLLDCEYIQNLPYVHGKQDPLWEDCSEVWPLIEGQLEKQAATLTAILCEPIVQGAAGMLMYSPDLLRRLRQWTTEHGIHLIVDEIMTGFGRTGKTLAIDYANIVPDFICLAKGLTAGYLPMSAVLTSPQIYDIFYHDDVGQAFLHSNTFAGNPLAAAVANAALDIYEQENICAEVTSKENLMRELIEDIAQQTKRLKNVRQLGAIVAADLIVDGGDKITAQQIFQSALKQGALLRPLGNTLYWLPPLNIEKSVLFELHEATLKAIPVKKVTSA